MTGPLLSAQQVAERLGVHTRTVHRYVREGRLPAARVGNRYRISSTDLAAFLGDSADTSTVEAAPPARADVTAELWNVTADDADRIRALLLGAAGERHGRSGAIEIHIAHEPEGECLRATIRGPLQLASAALSILVVATQEQ